MEFGGVALIAAGIILFALVSGKLQNSVLTAPMVFAGFGFVAGDGMFGWVELGFDNEFIRTLAEITLIYVLFSDAARIELREVASQNLPGRMLLIGMPLVIGAGIVAGWLLPLEIGFWQLVLLAAVLAPTDAALGQSVVTNPGIPVRIRQALNIESGLNDGIALPLILLFAALAGAGGQHAVGIEFAEFVAFQLVLGPLVGLVIGWLGAWSLDRAAASGWMSMSLEGAAILALALLAFAAAESVEGNGFISAFVAGLVFGNRVRERCSFLFEFIEAEGQLLVLITFLIFGGAILPSAIPEVTLPIVIYAVLSLTVVRMLPIGISLIGTGIRLPTYLFLGWFGPRGLASILFALLILDELETPGAEQISIITITTVVLSILLHGVTAAPFARAYARLAEQVEDCEEKNPVNELPTRHGMVPVPPQT